MTLPLSKTLDPADFLQLTEELAIVDQYFTSAAEQHLMRRWEYALALNAMQRWGDQQTKRTYRMVDVGGAGSPFWKMAGFVGREATVVVDPKENYELAEYLTDLPRLSPVVTCLSVLEHVEDLDRFLYHLACLVAPGGLLFLTMDCWDRPYDTPDTAHFHWMRNQIFACEAWRDLGQLRHRFEDAGPSHPLDDFTLFGEADWTYHGPHVYDYSFASLALIKRA